MYAGRVRAVAGDMTQPGLGLDHAVAHAVADAVDEVVHRAAAVSFDLNLEQARAINVRGTREMLELARLCHRRGGLRRFTYISTAYVVGLHKGRFGEDDLDVGQRFRNAYERSKFESEQLATNQGLEAELARVSRVVGKEGKLSQRVASRGSDGVWAGSIDSVNSLIEDLVRCAGPVAGEQVRARRREALTGVPHPSSSAPTRCH